MKINRGVKVIIGVYLAIYVFPPIVKSIIYVTTESEKIKEIKKDFELRKNGIITVDYREVKE